MSWFLLLALGCGEEALTPASLTASEEALDLGEVPVDTSGSASFTLENPGEEGEIELYSVSLVEGASNIWSIDRDDVDLLGPGDSLTVTVAFTPAEEGAADGQIQIRSSDPDYPSLYVALTGVGTPSTVDGDGDGYSPADGDCDDDRAEVHPGADEICDGYDNDCSGAVPADEADGDYDGWRLCDEHDELGVGDCDDSDANVYPGAEEICDDKDSDCDGVNPDYDDADGDGFTICDGDCEDGSADALPGGVEVCDGYDNDCSGDVDDIDLDGDGHSGCDPAADCDDDDFDAHPVAVDPESGSDSNPGTWAEPLATIDAALAALDDTCRTIYLAAGEYEVSVSLSGEDVSILGAADASEEPDAEVILRPPEGARIFELSGGASLALADLTLTGADISGVDAESGDGGAILVDGAALSLAGVTVSSNACSGDGGAIAVSSGSLDIEDCAFYDNTAGDDGGAIAAVSSQFSDRGSIYSGNAGVIGGALLLNAAEIDVDGSEFSQNDASDSGGGVAIVGSSVISLERSTFALNTAGARGGGLSVADANAPDGSLSNLVLADNAAGEVGGGVAFSGATAALTFANNTVVSNEAASGAGAGGGVHVDASAADGLTIWSNLVVWSGGTSGLYVADGAGADVAWCTGYATSGGSDFAGEAAAGVDNNTSENPVFSAYGDDGNPDNDDLTLQPSSPARDSGPSLPGWADTDGSQNDRGHTGGPGAN